MNKGNHTGVLPVRASHCACGRYRGQESSLTKFGRTYQDVWSGFGMCVPRWLISCWQRQVAPLLARMFPDPLVTVLVETDHHQVAVQVASRLGLPGNLHLLQVPGDPPSRLDHERGCDHGERDDQIPDRDTARTRQACPRRGGKQHKENPTLSGSVLFVPHHVGFCLYCRLEQCDQRPGAL